MSKIRKEEIAKKKSGKNERGASLVEYALLVGLIAVAAIAGVTALGTSINTSFTNIGTELTNNVPAQGN